MPHLLRSLRAFRDLDTPNRWSLSVVTPPAVEPVALDGQDGARAHLRLEDEVTEEDGLISALIKASREWAEGFQGRAYITQTITLTLDRFPFGDTILLPRPPLQEVTSIVYTIEDGTQRTFDASNYFVDGDHTPPRIVLQAHGSWPTEFLRPAAAVEVTYIAGYGAAGSDVPESVRSAIKLILGNLYENRELATVGIGIAIAEIPFAAETLLWMDRVFFTHPDPEGDR